MAEARSREVSGGAPVCISSTKTCVKASSSKEADTVQGVACFTVFLKQFLNKDSAYKYQNVFPRELVTVGTRNDPKKLTEK